MSNFTVDDGEEDGSLSALFLCEEYVKKSWKFGDIWLELLCSNMSTTDHDLTGQIVWPAAVVLGWFIYHNRHNFQGIATIELGAGCGLSGFLAGLFCSKTLITDGNKVVLRLLEQNRVLLSNESVHVSSLIWGRKKEVEDTIQTHGAPDVIIGADVVLWPSFVHPLLITVRWLLAYKASSSVCYISYVLRAVTTTNLFFSTAEELGLTVKVIKASEFLPDDVSDLIGAEGKSIFEVRLSNPHDIHLDKSESAAIHTDILSSPY